MRHILQLALSLFLIFSLNLQSQTVQEDFEGSTTNYNWSGYPVDFSMTTNAPNPFPQGINTSTKVLKYHDYGAQYGNVFFDVNGTFDLSASPVFSLRIYIPSSGLTGNQANQISLKLQNGNLAQPWVTQSEIIKPVTLDQWQTITFDFANDAYINFDPNSPPPVQRTDFNRVLLQVNGENNYDHVIAYIDDIAFDGVSNGGGTDYSVYFTDYDLFISKLNELTASPNTSSELNQFWSQLLATGNFPFVIDNEVAFLYRGSANSIHWAGDFNNSNPTADLGVKLGVSDIWLLEKVFPMDARLSYKIVKNGNEWLADPHNPHPVGEEWGNSQLIMPNYVIPSETIYDPTVPTGNFSDNILINSTNLGYTSQYRVYTPAGYNQLSNLPVVYVTDGHNFSNNTFGKMRIVMDNLIDNGTIEPIIAVFLDPRDPYNLNINRRSDEYRNNINFVSFVTNELVPVIDANYSTDPNPASRAILGSSYGGYNSAYFLAKATNQIHNNAILSAIMHPNPPNSNVFNNFLADLTAADLSNSNIYMSYGTFAYQEDQYFGILQNIFNQKGKAFESDILNDGHNYFNWNSVIGDALEYFFPAQPLSVEDHLQPLEFSFYPNPASDRVTVITQERVSVSIFDINGRKLLEQIAENEATLNLEGFETGIYIIKVEGRQSSASKKLLIK
jgi:enterochelin esterase family protein